MDSILCQKQIKRSSTDLRKYLSHPAKNIHFSIDGLALTMPISATELKKMYHIDKIIQSETGLLCRNIKHDYQETYSAKYMNRIEVMRDDGKTISLLWKGLSDRQRDLKLDINPYSFGFEETSSVLNVLGMVFGHKNYIDLIQRSVITHNTYTMDVFDVFIGHVLPKYSYSRQYCIYIDSFGRLTGTRIGKKAECPITSYEKANEQDGEYLDIAR